MNCILCASSELKVFPHRKRSFHQCSNCALVFLEPTQRIDSREEKAIYELHNNDVQDPRYQEFVRPVVDTIISMVKPGSFGLDFGAGTGPVASLMLQNEGFSVKRYDPFFWPDTSPLSDEYDFVFACEVVEHFSNPYKEFKLLRKLLRDRSPLAIMTLRYDSKTNLNDWYYLNDPTHVCAYSETTFHWIANCFGFESPVFQSDRICVLNSTKKER